MIKSPRRQRAAATAPRLSASPSAKLGYSNITVHRLPVSFQQLGKIWPTNREMWKADKTAERFMEGLPESLICENCSFQPSKYLSWAAVQQEMKQKSRNVYILSQVSEICLIMMLDACSSNTFSLATRHTWEVAPTLKLWCYIELKIKQMCWVSSSLSVVGIA